MHFTYATGIDRIHPLAPLDAADSMVDLCQAFISPVAKVRAKTRSRCE